MTAWSILLSIVLGLAINELSDISPWAARRLVGWSAQIRYRDPQRAEIRAEELAAVINDRPGKLLKLGTALRLVCSAVVSRARGLENAAEGGVNLDDLASSLVARYLFPTEKFRGEWKRHWIHPLKSLLVGLLMAGLAVAATWRQFPSRYASWITAGIVVAYLGWATIRCAEWYRLRFVLTHKRIMSTGGLLGRQVYQMPLLRVTDMRYQQSPLGRLLGYGTFQLEGASRRNRLRRIKDLPHPNELYLRLVEEMYEPDAVEMRIAAQWDAEEPAHSVEEMYEPEAVEARLGIEARREPTLAEQVALLTAAVERLNRTRMPHQRRVVRRSAPTTPLLDSASPPADGAPLQERLA